MRKKLQSLQNSIMAKKIALHPVHPERICWGCDKYCPADSLACGNGSERSMHPIELFGEDWLEWGIDAKENPPSAGKQIPIKLVEK